MTKNGIAQEGIDYVINENGEHVLTKKTIKKKVREMKNRIFFIHSDVCYLLNFGELGQERATAMSKCYNIIDTLLDEYLKEDHGAEGIAEEKPEKEAGMKDVLSALVKGLAKSIKEDMPADTEEEEEE